MRQTPTVHSLDNHISASAVEFRPGRLGGGDWYITWISEGRPWEVSVMRLPHEQAVGRGWHHGRSFAYRAQWCAGYAHRPIKMAAAVRSGDDIGNNNRDALLFT